MAISRRALLGGALGLALVGCASSEEAAAVRPVRSGAVMLTGAGRPPPTPADAGQPPGARPAAQASAAERMSERAAGALPPSWLRGQVVRPGPGAEATAMAARAEPPAAPGQSRRPDARRLAVPYRSQLDGSPYAEANCGPTSVAMVLDYYGQHVPTRDLRAIVNDRQGTWGVYDAGSTIEGLAESAERYGLRSLDLQAGKKLRRWTLDDVRRHLDAGRPIVPQLWYRGMPDRASRPYDGDHYVVLTGYGDDEVVYNDPIDKDGPGAGRRMTWAQLDKAWRNSDFPYAAFAVAEPAPR